MTDTRTQGAVDTGLNPHATDSDGNTYENPKPYYQMERRLRRWQRGPGPQDNTLPWLVEAQRRIDSATGESGDCARTPSTQMTRDLVNRYSMLVVEDLNVAGIMKGPTPKAQADSAMGEIRRQLEYNATGGTPNWLLPIGSTPAASYAAHARPTTRNSSGKGTGPATPAGQNTRGTPTLPSI